MPESGAAPGNEVVRMANSVASKGVKGKPESEAQKNSKSAKGAEALRFAHFEKMPSNHWWPEVRCEKTVAPATTNVLILSQPKCARLPLLSASLRSRFGAAANRDRKEADKEH